LKVEQVMARNIETCRADDSLDQVAQIMWEHDCGVVPVVVAGDGAARVVGMLTDRDLCMASYTQGRALKDIPVGSVVTQRVCSCRPSDTIAVALKVMKTNQLHRLPVVDQENRLVGLVSLADLAREAASERGVKRAQITDADIGVTVEAISAPRAAGTLVASA